MHEILRKFWLKKWAYFWPYKYTPGNIFSRCTCKDSGTKVLFFWSDFLLYIVSACHTYSFFCLFSLSFFLLASTHSLQDLSSLTWVGIQALTVKVPKPNYWTIREFPLPPVLLNLEGLSPKFPLGQCHTLIQIPVWRSSYLRDHLLLLATVFFSCFIMIL